MFTKQGINLIILVLFFSIILVLLVVLSGQFGIKASPLHWTGSATPTTADSDMEAAAQQAAREWATDWAGQEQTSTTTSGNTGSGSIPLPEKPASLPTVSVETVVNLVIRTILAVGQIAFVIVLLIGGVMIITAAGSEEKVEKAKKLITYAVIGIVILFSAWAIATYLVGKLK